MRCGAASADVPGARGSCSITAARGPPHFMRRPCSDCSMSSGEHRRPIAAMHATGTGCITSRAPVSCTGVSSSAPPCACVGCSASSASQHHNPSSSSPITQPRRNLCREGRVPEKGKSQRSSFPTPADTKRRVCQNSDQRRRARYDRHCNCLPCSRKSLACNRNSTQHARQSPRPLFGPGAGRSPSLRTCRGIMTSIPHLDTTLCPGRCSAPA